MKPQRSLATRRLRRAAGGFITAWGLALMIGQIGQGWPIA